MNYISWRIIDGKPRWVIIDENGNIINKEPTKEELKCLKMFEKLRPRATKDEIAYKPIPELCDCGCERKLTSTARREYINGKWTGRWLARACYDKGNPNSTRNKAKKSADFRNNNLKPNSPAGKGYISQRVTCMTRGIEDLNIINDNFRSPIDHSRDPVLGIIQSKSALFNRLEGHWHNNTGNEHNKEFDYLIFYCISGNGKIIEKVYIFPKYEVIKSSSITIYKDPLRGNHWYEKYIVDEKHYNDAYQQILKEINEGKDSIIRKGD